jgi:hypothetical protein
MKRRRSKDDDLPAPLATLEETDLNMKTKEPILPLQAVELEEEAKRMMEIQKMQSSIIELNVGGSKFTTSLPTLTAIPNTMLWSMFCGRRKMKPRKEDGAFFIDRDGTHFRHILNCLRHVESIKDVVLCLDPLVRRELQFEADFYGLREHMFDMEHMCP